MHAANSVFKKKWSKSLGVFILAKNRKASWGKKSNVGRKQAQFKRQPGHCSEAEFPRWAYHFPLQASSSSIEPDKPPMMKNAQHKAAQETEREGGEAQKSIKQETKIPTGWEAHSVCSYVVS